MTTNPGNIVQWVATSRNRDVSDRGWSVWVSRGDGPGSMQRTLGFWFTTVNKPSDDKWRKFNSRAGRLLIHPGFPPSEYALRLIHAWPGYLVLTTDGRGIYISAFDFFNDKPTTDFTVRIRGGSRPRYGSFSTNYRHWGDFTCRLLESPLVAQIEDLPWVPPAGAIRAYSEEDVFLLLENPELELMELGTLAERVQQVNALRAQIAQLETTRAQLEAHLAQIATQKAKTGFETMEAVHARSGAEQQLQEVLARELALQQQLAAAQASQQQLAAAQVRQVGADNKTWLWVAAAAGAAALLWSLWRKR